MKILICTGSYRKRGNTARITGMIEEQLRELTGEREEPLEIERVDLAHWDIKQCRGCRACFDQGEVKCPLKDDIAEIKEKMLWADGLVIGSPVYVNDVCGVVKNWIDRLAYVCHRPEFSGKCAFIVATVGDGPTKHALRTMSMALNLWGFYIVGQAGFKTGALMAQKEMETRYREESRKIARDLFEAIHSHRFADPSFLSLMTFRIQQRYWQNNGAMSTDYIFWRERGWTNSDVDYYIPHGANRLKVAAARLTGSVLARYVT
jgi:multimeric flavodoxin WrbA